VDRSTIKPSIVQLAHGFLCVFLAIKLQQTTAVNSPSAATQPSLQLFSKTTYRVLASTGLMSRFIILCQGNQEPLVVKDKDGRELGLGQSMEFDTFSI